MLFFFVLILVAWSLWTVVGWFTDFYHNLEKAKRSGIHYIPVPVHVTHRFWLVAHPLYFPLLRKLPDRYTAWVDVVIPNFGQDYGHEIFERIGHDTFLAVAPGGITMHTCEPAVVSQITTRRNDFPKPTKIYAMLDIYGKNVVSTEGHTWRRHRKATSPPFTEKNNHAVWIDTIDEASKMLHRWVGKDGKGGRPVERVMDDTMRLSLHVISKVGFGQKLVWPSVDDQKAGMDHGHVDPSKIQNDEDSLDHGHRMTYTYAIHCLLDNILVCLLVPRWVLKWTPVDRANRAGQSYLEWGNYMKEMIVSKREAIEQGPDTDQTDIIGLLVKGQMEDRKTEGTSQLTDDEILGNLFVLMLAGHETSANSIHFTMLLMALYPKSQRLLQRDLDNIFQGRPPSEWSYQHDFHALIGGVAGAVMNEQLRLLPPAVNVYKSTFDVSDQSLMVDGRPCTVPKGIEIELCTPGAHRNPKYWPTGPPTYPGGKTAHPRANIDNDLEEFRPERWLVDDEEAHKDGEPRKLGIDGGHRAAHSEILSEDGKPSVKEPADSSDRLYKPAPGAYFPFSDGYRSCLGRRFAQVEVLAAIAVIFQNYSVELAVDKYTSADQLVKMDTNARADVWQKAAEDARELLLSGLGVMITLQMHAGHVNLRLRPRGQEQFPDDVDEIWKKNHPDLCSTSGVPTWSSWKGPKIHRSSTSTSGAGAC